MTFQEALTEAMERGPRTKIRRANEYESVGRRGRMLRMVDLDGRYWPLDLTVDDVFATDWEIDTREE